MTADWGGEEFGRTRPRPCKNTRSYSELSDDDEADLGGSARTFFAVL